MGDPQSGGGRAPSGRAPAGLAGWQPHGAMLRYFGSAAPSWLLNADRSSPWSSLRVLVAGLGVTGYSAATGLLGLGARVHVVADTEPVGAAAERAGIIEALGGTLAFGSEHTSAVPGDCPLVVISPGFLPRHPLVQAALTGGVALFTDIDLARRLEHPERRATWLAVTGSNGKTTTTQMVAAIGVAAGLDARVAGNIGEPIVDVVLDPDPPDLLAVEVSAQQLHYSPGLATDAAVVLNLAPDHLDFHGDLAGYGADKARVFDGVATACVYNVDDPATRPMVEAAEVREGARAVGFTLGIPSVSQVGVVDDLLVDRAFVAERQTAALPLLATSDLVSSAPHVVADALAAAALTRSQGISAGAVRSALSAFRIDRHRIEDAGTAAGVAYVNDSKATNPHAAEASLLAYSDVVWIAGGKAKGLEFDDLVQKVGDRLRAVVLLGTDRGVVKAALSRHAPQVPVVDVTGSDTRAMADVVAAASRFAQPGDTVLLAPGCASTDMFAGFGARGDAFVEQVRALPGWQPARR